MTIERRAAEIASEFGPRLAPVPELPAVDLWDERPVLRHLHDFARARRVAPLAVLGVAIARIIAATPVAVTLPALIGGPGTLNVFVAAVGESGAGKGAAEAATADALRLCGEPDPYSEEEGYTSSVGSGEGFLHQYVRRNGKELVRVRESVLFSIAEADTLTALAARQGTTLMPVLRSAYSGERLAFAYADPTKALAIPAHSYRAAVILGVQPLRAGPLLDDADGGTPQRFLWVPVTDPDMPRQRPAEPPPMTVRVPVRPAAVVREMGVCAEARDEIDEAHWRRSRGDGDALDGHALYTRLKVAAALALLDERLTVDAEDWRIAGRIMAASDRTRDAVAAALRERQAAATTARAHDEATRAVVVTEAVEAAAVQRASRAVLAVLEKQPGEWVTGADLRRGAPSRVRPHLDDALAALEMTGVIETEPVEYHGRPGRRYRRPA